MRLLSALLKRSRWFVGGLALALATPAFAGVPGGPNVNLNIRSQEVQQQQVHQILNEVVLESLWEIIGKAEQRDVWGPNPAPPKFWEFEVTVSDAEFATALAEMKTRLYDITQMPGRKNVYRVLQDEQTGDRLDLVSQNYEEVQTGQSTDFEETVDTHGAQFGVDYVGDPNDYFTWIAIGASDVNVDVDQITTTTTFLDAITTNEYNQLATWQISTLNTVSPILLDMDGDGKIQASGGEWLPHEKLHTERLAFFDFYGDKFPVLMEWAGPDDGILCRPNPDGSIDGTSLFGTANGFKDGFEALKALDSDSNGRLEGAELDGLYVWLDTNGDARPQPSEVRPIQEHGITEISVNHKNYVSYFVQNGERQAMFDWWPQMYELNRIKVAPKNA